MTTLRRGVLFLLCSMSLLFAAGTTARAGDAVPAATCAAGPTTLCLNAGRFRIDVQWKDFQNHTGVGQAVPLTPDTGYFWFFNAANVELVVKVLDGRGLNSHFWVFFGALSNVEYTMTVTDTVSGGVRTYFNPSGRFASVGDTNAFAANGAVDTADQYAQLGDLTPPFAMNELALPPRDASETAAAGCVPTETSLCLNGGRFRLEANWKDFQGNTGVGRAIPLSSDTGYFWFFNSANVELAVKVLDGRDLNNRFWVFYGALSNVEYEMTVTDTVTGNINRYRNPSGRFASTGDTNAFRAGFGVGVQLDESRAVSKDVSTSGGTVTAVSSNGTVFTLTIPKDALLSQSTITMTPVTAIDGLPLSGGLAGAVNLTPAGLRLFDLATLSVAPPTPVAVADEITVGWRGSGQEFFLYPPVMSGSAISMKLTRLGGYGVGRGSAGDQAAQLLRVPASAEDALSQRLQNLIAVRRKAKSAGIGVFADSDAEFFARLEAELRAYYDSVLAAEIEIGRVNCERGKAIFPKAIGWSRSVALLGLSSQFAEETQAIQDAWLDGMVNCYNESFDKCVNKNDPAQVQQLLSYLRQLELMGASDRVDQNKVEKCARFELDFESVIDEKAPYGEAFRWRHQVRAIVPLAFSLSSGVSGNADLRYSSVTYTGPDVSPCTQTTVGTNSVFQAQRMAIDFNVVEGGRSPAETLTMEYDPGFPVMTFTMTCPGPGPPIVFTQERWRSEYYDHFHSADRSGGGFTARDWASVGGAIYARKTYQLSNAFADETTIFNLKHTPQP
jgi:hypothetical protein